MARYVITVGGTGQHIALALTRLARLGAVKDIKLIAIDADTQTTLPLKLGAPTVSLTGSRHPLGDGVVRAPFDVAQIGEKSFAELFVDQQHRAEQELFEVLFDEDEASIPVAKGMFGTPCVGATVFADGANNAQLASLLSPVAAAQEVYICGSVVGGTGAGVIHKLVQEVRKKYAGDLFGVFLLPWFNPPPGAGRGAITPAIIERNKTHGIKYFYEHTIPKLTCSLLIGYPGTTRTAVLRPLDVKDGDMGEQPSYLHLAAARGMLELAAAHTANRNVKAYGIVHERHREGWLLDEPWGGGRTLRRSLRAARLQMNLLRFVTDAANRQKIAEAWGLLGDDGFFRPLADSIIQNAGKRGNRQQYCEGVLTRFQQIVEELAFCIDWAQVLFPDGMLEEPNDAMMNALAAADKQGSDSKVKWQAFRETCGAPLAPDATGPRTPEQIAEHHASAIFQAGLHRS